MAAFSCVRVFVRVAFAAAILAAGVTLQASVAVAAPDSAIVVDAKTGKTLYADNPDAKRYPASLTKMMTLYLLFGALDSGRTSLDDKITFSAHASAQEPTKLGLDPGDKISVRDAILAVVTLSANDVAVAIGEYLGGSEPAFAKTMTAKAHELGMSGTTFHNASGLPDSQQFTTARDMATLGRALREHYPQYYSFFSTRSFVWDGERITGHNPLLGNVDGVDGIKTGYTVASGFNLVTSIRRSGHDMVAVVLGGDTASWRDQHMEDLVDEYLPKSSVGAHTAPAIPGGPDGTAVASLTKAPLPRARPDDQPASASSFATGSVAPIVGSDAGFAAQPVGQGDAPAKNEPAAPPTVAGGWKIQISAAPTRSSAEDFLDRALASAPTVLASAKPYTEPVTVGKDTLYRARFSGFTSQQEAKAACTALAKRSFDCLAVNN